MISRAIMPDEVYESEGHGAIVTEGQDLDDDIEADKRGEVWKKE